MNYRTGIPIARTIRHQVFGMLEPLASASRVIIIVTSVSGLPASALSPPKSHIRTADLDDISCMLDMLWIGLPIGLLRRLIIVINRFQSSTISINVADMKT